MSRVFAVSGLVTILLCVAVAADAQVVLVDDSLLRSGIPTPGLFGAVLFQSPEILGDALQKRRVSCQTCHPNGAPAKNVNGLVKNGAVDFSKAPAFLDDGIENPVSVPSLRGVGARPAFGTHHGARDLGPFLRRHLVEDLGAPVLSVEDEGFLVAYVARLSPLLTPGLGSDGALTALASKEARRGEAVFQKKRAALGDRSCASCHVPAQGFSDGAKQAWLRDPRAMMRTPSLLGLNERASLFADGSAASVGAVVEEYDRAFQLRLSAGEKSDLKTYLTVVGGEVKPDTRTVQSMLKERATYLAVVEDERVSSALCANAVRRLSEALSKTPAPKRIAFKVDGAIARVDRLVERCADDVADERLTAEIARLSDDLLRLAEEWESEIGAVPRETLRD